MRHLTEEELTLHYYEKSSATAKHLAECGTCRDKYEEVSAFLGRVTVPELPERPADYGRQVWQRIAQQVSERPYRRSWWMLPRTWALAGAMAAIAIVAFVAGRVSQNPPEEPIQPVVADQQRERVLQVALGEHLDRTQRMLLEMANEPVEKDSVPGREQRLARDLADANRLYRQTAEQVGDDALVSMLDELERFLIKVAHGDVESGRKDVHVESEDLLFKIRVIRSNLNRELASPERFDMEAAATPRVQI